MAIFPKIYKILEYQKNRYGTTKALEYAIVEDGCLIASCGVMIIKIDLRIYFPPEQVAYTEGKVFNVVLLRHMAAPSVNELYLTPSGVSVHSAKFTTDYHWAGANVGENNYDLHDIITDKKLKAGIAYPNYKSLFPENFIPKSYPYTGINATSLEVLSHAFWQSIEKGSNLVIESREGEAEFQQGQNVPFRVTPFYKAEDENPEWELAMFSPSHVPGLQDLEEMM